MVLNVGGESRVTLNSVLTIIQELTKSGLHKRYLPAAREDHLHGAASINLARQHLQWEPRVSLREGLARQWSWLRQDWPAQQPGRAEVPVGV